MVINHSDRSAHSTRRLLLMDRRAGEIYSNGARSDRCARRLYGTRGRQVSQGL